MSNIKVSVSKKIINVKAVARNQSVKAKTKTQITTKI